eukprot:5494071-Prymnesium_polylepis.1
MPPPTKIHPTTEALRPTVLLCRARLLRSAVRPLPCALCLAPHPVPSRVHDPVPSRVHAAGRQVCVPAAALL